MRDYSTQTKTVTAVVSAVDTITVTTFTTSPATTTVLFTESRTTTASTTTNTVLQTTTVLATLTNIQTAPAITIATTVYCASPAKMMARDTELEVVARGNNPWGIPDYAWPACQDWDQYVDACKCFGIQPLTVTNQPTTTTVTVTAPNAVTTTVSTLTTTTTSTVSVTVTTSATFTAVIEVIASATITQTITATSTVFVTTTVTPTVTSTTLCKATGVPFRVAEAPGDPLHFYITSRIFGSWVEDEAPLGDNDIQASTFVLDSNGFIELATPFNAGAPDDVLILELSNSIPSERIIVIDQVQEEGDGDSSVRIKGCVDPVTNVLSLSADGRNNILDCDGRVILSSTDGSETNFDCVTVFPVAE